MLHQNAASLCAAHVVHTAVLWPPRNFGARGSALETSRNLQERASRCAVRRGPAAAEQRRDGQARSEERGDGAISGEMSSDEMHAAESQMK